MKKLFFSILTILYVLNTIAQAPNKMSYQAVIRNSSNTLVVNQTVGMRISILQNSSTGTAVYIETQTPMTNANGLATLEIGTGTVVSGVFASINWSAGPYFIKTETDPTGGISYSIIGISQLMSVPYALYAQNSGNTLNPGVGIIISGSTIEAIDNSYLNELQTLTISNDTIKLNPSGGFIKLPNITNNWDISGTDIYNNNLDNVGIGTSTPTSKLDVNGQVTIDQKNFGGYGGLLIKGDAPGSNYPNIAFSIFNDSGNDEVAAYIGGNINDNVTGSESMDLSFMTSQSGLSGMTEKMRIFANGNVSIGNDAYLSDIDYPNTISLNGFADSNKANLVFGYGGMITGGSPIYEHLYGAQNFGDGFNEVILASKSIIGDTRGETGGFYADGNTATIWSPGDDNGGQPYALLYFVDEDHFDPSNSNPYDISAVRGYIDPNGALVSISDSTKKQNITSINNALSKILNIGGYEYQFKLAPTEIEKGQKPVWSSGVLAQEVEKQIPTAVQKSDAGDYFVNYSALIPYLIESIKEQQMQIKSQQNQIDELKKLLLEITK